MAKQKFNIIKSTCLPIAIDNCNFCPRCTCAETRCETVDAVMSEVTPGHFVKCVKCCDA